jgi:hypothetical protein
VSSGEATDKAFLGRRGYYIRPPKSLGQDRSFYVEAMRPFCE